MSDSYEMVKKEFQKLIIRNPGINLHKNEICVFFAHAYIGKKKEKTKSYDTMSIHANARMFGLNFRSGNTKVNKNTITYWEKIPCRFYVTSDRFIALSETGGFTATAKSILDIKLYTDGIVIYCGNKTHTIFLNDNDLQHYRIMWNLIGRANALSLDFAQLNNNL